MKQILLALFAVSAYAQLAGNGTGGAVASTPTFTSGGTTTCDLTIHTCQVNFGATGNTTLAFTNPNGAGPYLLRTVMNASASGTQTYTFGGTMKGFAQPNPAATQVSEQYFSYDGTNYNAAPASNPTSAWHGVSAPAVAFTNFPACAAATEGTFGTVNDSSTTVLGATVTGSSSGHILMYCNGTNWIVVSGATATPQGSAGGDLSGTYPNPSIGAAKVAPSMMKASTWDSQTDGATVTWAIGSVLNAQATLTFTVHSGSRTLNITNPVVGGFYTLKIIQDSTGGEGLTLGTGCTWKVSGGGGGAITPSTTANAVDILSFAYDGTNCWANFNKNFN